MLTFENWGMRSTRLKADRRISGIGTRLQANGVVASEQIAHHQMLFDSLRCGQERLLNGSLLTLICDGICSGYAPFLGWVANSVGLSQFKHVLVGWCCSDPRPPDNLAGLRWGCRTGAD